MAFHTHTQAHTYMSHFGRGESQSPWQRIGQSGQQKRRKGGKIKRKRQKEGSGKGF